MQGISIDYVWISPYFPKSTWQDLANSYGTSRISQEIRAPPGFELRKLSNLTNTSECLGSLVGRYLQHTWVVYQDIYIYIQMSVFCWKLLIIDYQKDTKKQFFELQASPTMLGMSSKYRYLDVWRTWLGTRWDQTHLDVTQLPIKLKLERRSPKMVMLVEA